MKALTISGLIIAVIIGGLSACTVKSAVDLNYQPADINLPPCDRSISLVELVDERGEKAVGKTNEGKLFYGNISVTEWVSRALYKELEKSGCRVKYHEKEYSFDTDYTLTGKIQDVFVTQVSLTEYNASMRLKLAVKTGEEQIFNRQFSSTYSKKTVPSPGVNSKVLTVVLQGMMKEVVPEIRKNLK